MKINLANFVFTDKPTVVAEDGEFKAVGFRYSTGVEALKVSNRRGSFTILPWMGQMIWRCDFDGRELAMKSMYDEPKDCKESFSDSYGCFMMHCGLTAMGNPTPEDTHIGHAELPVARYQEAYLEFGTDKGGDYVAVGGTYQHDLCFTYNYAFSPRVVLRKGAAKIEISATVKNQKDIPFEYYYLCHVNHRPVDGSKIVAELLPYKYKYRYLEIERYSMYIFFALIILLNRFDFISCEKLPQFRLVAHNLARLEVVRLAVHGQPGVVEGRDGIHHRLRSRIVLRQLQAGVDYRTHMILLVRLVEMLIARDNLLFYILL